MLGCSRGRARDQRVKAGIFREVTGMGTERLCGVGTAARFHRTSCKAGKGSAPARSTREGQGGGYKRDDVKSHRGTESGGSGCSTDDPADMITADEERTRGRSMGGSGCVGPDTVPGNPYVAGTPRMSEPTRQELGYMRVPLSQHPRVADSGRSGRLKPYWGKPAVRNFRGPAGNRAGWRTEAPPTERGG